MAPTGRIPISRPGHFGINMAKTNPMKRRVARSFTPQVMDNLDWHDFLPGKLAGEIFTLEMDEDILADISSNTSDNYTLDVHDFNLEEWDRNMRKRGFKSEDIMEYVVETFYWKRSLESRYQPGDIFSFQEDVTTRMRYNCSSWIATVTRKMGFTLETFCLAVNYMDRFLCVQPIEGNCLQLVGLTAFLIAAKQEEVDPPQLSELVTLCGAAFSPVYIQNMEKIMLARLNFMLLAPTSGFFLQLLVEVLDERDWPIDLARHLVEMVMCDPVLSQLPPLKIAKGVHQVIKACPQSVLISISINCPKCDPHCENDDFLENCFENLLNLVFQSEC